MDKPFKVARIQNKFDTHVAWFQPKEGPDGLNKFYFYLFLWTN